MPTIHAIYQNGVFRPTTPVDLPEGSEVTIEPTPIGGDQELSSHQDDTPPLLGRADGTAEAKGNGSRQPQASDPEFAHMDPGLARTYAILSHRYEGGSPDRAARHNEHQP